MPPKLNSENVVEIRFLSPAIRLSPVGERLGIESGSECQSDVQCRLSWGDLGVDCADSYMPVLLGNYLRFALLGFLSHGRSYRSYLSCGDLL